MSTAPSPGRTIESAPIDALIDNIALESGLELFLWTAEELLGRQRSAASQLLEDINLQEVTIARFSDVDTSNIVQVMVGGPGDDLDVGWLSHVVHAVAVENARPAILALADLVMGHHADDSVARLLERRFQLA